MENNQKIVKAFEKIQEALNGVQDIYPTIPKGLSKIISKVDQPLVVLKRVDGIIKNFNEDNVKQKLDSLLKYLNGILKK